MTTVTLDPTSFEYVRKLVQDTSAIALEPSKGYLVESRLLPLAYSHGMRTVKDLVGMLRAKPYNELHAQVVEAMTTNETSFFRDLHPFEVLQNEILPQLVSRRAAMKSLRIWSAACSSGQEAYTIAMIVAEHFPQLRDWNVQIVGCDLSQQMVDKAQRGEYTQLEVSRGLPTKFLVKYFERSGLHYRVKPEVSRLVRFLKVNLAEPWAPFPTMDVVFMRNVLIYFTPEIKRMLLGRVKKLLAPDGALFLGGAETTIGIDDSWKRTNHGKTSTYRLTP
jgi:chemotaxis protein methyltransferase CheR